MAHILVIDDELDYRNLLQALLEDEGYAVTTAENGSAGKTALTTGGVDLIITDMMMPDCNGLELLLAARACGASVPIVAMSGGGKHPELTDLVLDAAEKFGAAYRLFKPFELEELHAVVRSALDKSDHRN